MRIGVLRTQVPFVSGGAERHSANLVHQLNKFGHEATEITLPFKWYPGEVLADHILAARMIDLSEVEGVPVDMLIGLKFPAYLVPHPNKIFWIIHQHRQAYDQWDAGTSDLLKDPDGDALRQLIRKEDYNAFGQTQHPIYANSANVSARLHKYLGINSNPLYHPPPNADIIYQGKYDDYLFVPGRINPSKRLDLILKGLAASKAPMRLVIAGTAENPKYQEKLFKLVSELGIDKQVTWLGSVNDDTLLRFYANARAVVFAPQDEDYGYITLEAMLAAKPVITVTDSGGPLEFIQDGVEGFVTFPQAKALGHAFTKIMDEPMLAEKMGQAGHEKYQSLNISWENVVCTLAGKVQTAIEPVPSIHQKPKGEASDQDAQKLAVEALTEAITPPNPSKVLPFSSIREVLDTYSFDELSGMIGDINNAVDDGLANYLETHWTRYKTTISQIEDLIVKKSLDVGVFPPLVFQALMANIFPDLHQDGLWEGPNPYSQTIWPRQRDDLPTFNIRLEVANSECDKWPYGDGQYDLVTGMEILEHLSLDPYFFFSEAARVLKPGGYFLVTTPNVTSHRGVWKMLNRISPYSFGIFVPSGGVYGRHNREYAPTELEILGKSAGFETIRLSTYDVYDRECDPGIAELLVSREDDLKLRGETIFYLGQKIGSPVGAPEVLYHGNPATMAGAMHVQSQDYATGLTTIKVENHSSQWWKISGKLATCILLEWINADGTLRHQHQIQPLTAPIGPAESAEIKLLLDPLGMSDQSTLRLHLYQSGVGIMTGSGRASFLQLNCTEEAFLRIVKTMPVIN